MGAAAEQFNRCGIRAGGELQFRRLLATKTPTRGKWRGRFRLAFYGAAAGGFLVLGTLAAKNRRHRDRISALEKSWPEEVGKKQKLVVLGSGWGAMSLLRQLDPGLYDIHVVSPRNYFLFTPLLPSVTVGTVEARSIAAPIRKLLQRSHGDLAHYYEAEGVLIDADKKVH